jgi:signal transduction histidine kinase
LLHALALDLALVQLVAFGLLSMVVVERLGTTVMELESRDMMEAAQDLADHLSLKDGTRLTLSASDLARFSPSYGRYSYAVLDERGAPLLASTEPVQALKPMDPDESDPPQRFKVRIGGALWWGVTRHAMVDGRPILVQVAEDMNHRDALMDEIVSGFLVRAGWLLMPLLAVQIGIALVRMRRRFRPVLEASQSAMAITPGRGYGRIPDRAVPAEIQPLVVAVNSALDRIEGAYRTQKEFLENAAHQLKTPLAVLHARIDSLEDGRLRAELETDIAILSRLVTQMLRAAEMEGQSGHEQAQVDLCFLAKAIAGYLRPAADLAGKTIQVQADGAVTVSGCAETIGQAINNLVENAISHTPAGMPVEITVTGGAHPAITVRDHGPGIPEAERDLVFQRFWRADRRREKGAGLGLSIVRRAMELHGGAVRVMDAPGGGACFTLEFRPPAQPGPMVTLTSTGLAQ